MDVKLSKQKHQLTEIESVANHKHVSTLYITPVDKILIKRKKDNTKETNTLKVVIVQTTLPKKTPNKLPLKNPNKGSNKIKTSIYL